MRLLPLVLMLVISACATSPLPPVESGMAEPVTSQPRLSAKTAVRNFVAVVDMVEPVAERVCRQRAPRQNCDFRIVVDDRPNSPPNAFQTIDESGRPIIAFTIPLIVEARNRDELAFIMSHEAAHHIQGHLARQQRNASLGAVVFGQVAGALGGADPESVRAAQQFGAALGARRYSKDFELEADALGTRITAAAGFDPLRGADFFFRIPDPGNRFLGTHPANAERLRTVQRVAESL